jgi:hypothetical protein
MSLANAAKPRIVVISPTIAHIGQRRRQRCAGQETHNEGGGGERERKRRSCEARNGMTLARLAPRALRLQSAVVTRLRKGQ